MCVCVCVCVCARARAYGARVRAGGLAGRLWGREWGIEGAGGSVGMGVCVCICVWTHQHPHPHTHLLFAACTHCRGTGRAPLDMHFSAGGQTLGLGTLWRLHPLLPPR